MIDEPPAGAPLPACFKSLSAFFAVSQVKSSLRRQFAHLRTSAGRAFLTFTCLNELCYSRPSECCEATP